MLKLRNFVLAAATAAVAAGPFSPPAFAGASTASACRNQQGYRKLVHGVWHHYVTVFERRGWVIFSHEVDCGAAF